MKGKINWTEKTILLTGGTGSFGKKFTEIMVKEYHPKLLRVFSRDEQKQYEMQQSFKHSSVRFLVGDIREKERLARAMDSVDIVVHAAALKQVPSCEYNPIEAVRTNIVGMENIINVAIDCKVEKVIALSTDKAVSPANLYGATKMCMEKLVVAGNAYVGEKRQTRMSCVRYGNVIGSRGSVVPVFEQQKQTGTLTVTDKRMSRFWITLEQGVQFVIKCMDMMDGGEIFIPKIPSMKIVDLAKAVAPSCKIKLIGIRPGEKIHECLLTEDEARHAREFKDFYAIGVEFPFFPGKIKGGKKLAEGFRYTSNNNTLWLTISQLRRMIEK